MLSHIHQGDLYGEFFAWNFMQKMRDIELEKFQKLNEISNSICGFKNNKHFLLSASLERYLKKEGTVFRSLLKVPRNDILTL
jgi:para-aminobenzoate synthetase component 1